MEKRNRVQICTTIDYALEVVLHREMHKRDINLSTLLDEIIAAYFNGLGRNFPPPVPEIGDLKWKKNQRKKSAGEKSSQ